MEGNQNVVVIANVNTGKEVEEVKTEKIYFRHGGSRSGARQSVARYMFSGRSEVGMRKMRRPSIC